MATSQTNSLISLAMLNKCVTLRQFEVVGFKVKEIRYIVLFVISGLSESFPLLIVSIFVFPQYFFNKFYPVEKCGVTLHCLYRDS